MPEQLIRKLFRQIKLPSVFYPPAKFTELVNYTLTLTHKEKRYNQRMLVLENEVPDHIYLSEGGLAVASYFNDETGRDVYPFIYVEPSILSAWKAFFREEKAPFGIEVRAHVQVYSLSRAAVKAIEQRFPELSNTFQNIAKEQQTALKAYKTDLRRKSVDALYQVFIQQRAAEETRFPVSVLAAHLGTTIHYFSRVRKKYQKK